MVFVLMIAAMGIVACSSADSTAGKTVAERKAEENYRRSPVKKGRYHCYWLFKTGDKNAEELFVLSDKMYQVADDAGHYVFDKEKNTMKIIDGPLQWPADTLLGFYTAKGSPTVAGGHTLETMIEFRPQRAMDSGNRQAVLQCNCIENE